MLTAVLLLVAAIQDRPAPGPRAGSMDVGSLTAAPKCDSGSGDEIVVCGKQEAERFRLRPLAPRYVDQKRAVTNVAGGELSVEAEQRSLPGASAPAAMVRFRIPLGKAKK